MRFGQWIGFLGLLVSLYILWEIRFLLLLLFAAVLVAVALDGGVQQLCRWRVPKGLAIGITILVSLGSLALFLSLVVPPFAEQFNELARLFPKGFAALVTWLTRLQDDVLGIRLQDLNNGELLKQLQSYGNLLLERSVTFLFGTLGAAVTALLIFALAVMLLLDPKVYRQGFIRLFPAFYRRRVDLILTRCELSLRSWLLGTLAAMVAVGCLSFLALTVLHVRLSLAHALIAGLLNVIPNIGPTVSLVPPVAVALLDDPWKALGVLIAYIIIQQTDSYLVTPFVMAQQVALPPATSLTAQILFTTLFGLPGLLLALPLMVVALVWVEEVVVKDILDRWDEGPAGRLGPDPPDIA